MKNESYTPRGIIGDHALQGMMGASSTINAAHMASQRLLNEQALGMLNDLSLDMKVCGAVDEAKRLLQDVVMSERRVHASNVKITSGMGDSSHLSRQRVKLFKALDELIHLTDNERIGQFRDDCLRFLDALEKRREVASQYRHGQGELVYTVLMERMVDGRLEKLLQFVAADFGADPVPEVKPRRGILRSLFTRKDEDPAKWYLKFDFSR